MIRARCGGMLAALVARAATPAPATASKDQESIFMDDPKLVYSAPERLEGTLAEMKRLGADRIRVSVFWRLLAPDPTSDTQPFAAGAGADPRNYSAERWDRYDRIVTTAQQLGLKLLFSVTSPAPSWATPTPPRADLEDSFRPSPAEFKDFVKALGTRYSGSFADEAPRQGAMSVFQNCEPTPNFPIPPAVCSSSGSEPTQGTPNPPNTGPLLPRVDTWSIWNEPNMPGWLTPQSHEEDTRLPASPHVYRELADAMYSGLRETGHGSDAILLAETAPRGASKRAVTQSLAPLLFVRELYCLDRRFRPFTGDDAARRNCPPGGDGFAAAHPILFDATGFAHHPYAFEAPPSASDTTRDHAVLGDLNRLTRTLDRSLRAHASGKRFKVWLTEYGYQTDPPDPYSGWSWRTHARYLAEAEWIAFRKSRVRSTAQFLLYDDAPLHDYPPDDPRHWGTFQTGLRTGEGRKKPAYAGYQRTIHVPPRARRGRGLAVFGLYRPGAAAVQATVQFRRKGRKGWKTVARKTTNRSGFLVARPRASRSGAYRIGFLAGGRTAYTRAAEVRVSR
jgi:hypothetical protein